MSISTNHSHSAPYLAKSKIKSRVSLEEILDDFKSLENLAATVHLQNHMESGKNETKEDMAFLQLQDFRRPKLQEAQNSTNKLNKLNRSYTMYEIRTHGFELKTLQKEDFYHKMPSKSFLLSEYIL